MEFREINELLAAYWQGETSLQEEEKLKAYFDGDSIDPALQAYTPLFRFYRLEKEKTMPSSVGQPKIKRLPVVRKLWRYAAVGLIFVVALFGVWKWDANRITDAEYYEAMAALSLVGEQLNKGLTITSENLDQLKTIDDIFQ